MSTEVTRQNFEGEKKKSEKNTKKTPTTNQFPWIFCLNRHSLQLYPLHHMFSLVWDVTLSFVLGNFAQGNQTGQYHTPLGKRPGRTGKIQGKTAAKKN